MAAAYPHPTLPMLHAALHLALPLLLAFAPAPAAVQEPAPAAPAAPPLAKVAFVGASVSAGAWNSKELEISKDVGLGRFLEAAARPLPGPAPEGAATLGVLDLGNLYFFSDPRANGRTQLARVAKEEPTALVAVDFLFWYAFGERSRDDPRRVRGLEEGLAALEAYEGPLVVGDLPNIDHALEGKGPLGGPLVHRGMFPSEGERAEMNARIRAWAQERGNTAVVPVAGLVETMLGGGPIEVRGGRWERGDVAEALQPDRLHPTVLGTSWTALHVADALVSLGLAEPERFLWDGAEVARRVVAATEEERREKAERDARKEERRRAREAKTGDR